MSGCGGDEEHRMAQKSFPPERPFGRRESENEPEPEHGPLHAADGEGSVPAVGEPPAAQDSPTVAGPDDAAA
jgi:hypothetical protein